jgi:threonine synthase
MRRNLAGFAIDEPTTRRTIRELYARTSYLLDPHGAVGYAAACEFARADEEAAPIVTLVTAHPAKFSDAIAEELGFAPALPAGHEGWAGRPILATDLTDTEYEGFKGWLLSQSG